MAILLFLAFCFAACILQVSSTILTPVNDIHVCPLHLTSDEQTIKLVCNVTEINSFISWRITINGVTANVDFDSTSHLHQNKYRGNPGIEVSLNSASNYHLSSITVIRIPPFDVRTHSARLSCNRLIRSILPAGKDSCQDKN